MILLSPNSDFSKVFQNTFEKLRKEIGLNEGNLLKLDRKMYVEETMEADSYKRLKKQMMEAMENSKQSCSLRVDILALLLLFVYY